jgi:hypothetical protein
MGPEQSPTKLTNELNPNVVDRLDLATLATEARL